MDLEIREAKAADYGEMCTLFDEGDAFHRQSLPHIFQEPTGPVRDRGYVLGLISDEAVGLFVAGAENQLVGLVCVIIRESPPVPIFVPRRYAVIDSLVVKARFRRAGIGRALVETAQEWAVTSGADSIELNVWEFNRGAVEFYQQLGFATASRKMARRLRLTNSHQDFRKT
jgi:ribosomal protein S18 acetylase RimI-like enzyme